MIRDKLKSPEINCWCCIGISTGTVFSGVVGTSGSRKEFSVLGDSVNVAARIMGHSKKIKGKIYVGLQTAKDAATFIKFNYVEHVEFKGKTINLPIFEPLDPGSEDAKTPHDQQYPFYALKLHVNPFMVDRDNKFQETYCKLYGCEDLLETAVNDIIEFCSDLTYSLVISVNGQSGSGKTLFARAIIDKLRRVEPIHPKFDWANKEKIITLVASLNASSEKLFLNAWIPVLRIMLDILKVRKNTKKDIILSNLYKENEDISDKIFILERIFGLELPKEVDQMVIEEGPIAFVQRETYDEDTVEHIVDFISLFIQNELLEEHKYMNKDPDDHNLEVPPIIIFFDNVYMMDKPSWELLYNLRKNCHRISFVLCIKTDPNNRVIFHPEAVEIATEFYCDENTIDAMIDLPSLEENEIRQMLCDFSQEYTVQMKEEIERMTRIIDPAHSNKTPAESAKLKSEMTKNYNVSDDFNKIQKDVMNTIMSKCEGNPLVSMQFIINLMTSSMVITKEKVLYPNEKKFFD